MWLIIVATIAAVVTAAPRPESYRTLRDCNAAIDRLTKDKATAPATHTGIAYRCVWEAGR